MFELVPQSGQDIYYNRLQAGQINTAIVSTNDEKIDKDIQTDDLGFVNKFNQAPEDLVLNYNPNKDTYQRKKKR